MALMVLALVDVRWGKVWRDVPQKGIEVMFVLDVSRSMLADDAAPNRLERAKQQIKDTVDEMAGDRVGLIVFAGDVKQQIPLTTHYDDFKQALDEVGPHNVRRGGSRLGDAIEAASHAFLTKSNAHKAMVIFTDGEDQESEPVAAARKAHAETGVRIFTVGLGDMEKGSRIPLEVRRPARLPRARRRAGVVEAQRRHPPPGRHRDRRRVRPRRHQASQHVRRVPQLHRRRRADRIRNRPDQSVRSPLPVVPRCRRSCCCWPRSRSRPGPRATPPPRAAPPRPPTRRPIRAALTNVIHPQHSTAA